MGSGQPHEDLLPIDAKRYHVYAAEWTPTHIDFYVDNRKLRTLRQSPRYPMQFMLGIYERPSVADAGAETGPYPKTFSIDYFRAYQPMAGYR